MTNQDQSHSNLKGSFLGLSAIYLLKTVLWLVGIFYTSNAIAQQNYYQPSQKGYYHISTQPDTRNTIVRFYNQNDELVYAETIQGKYIKMTKRNVRLLNRTLERLSASGLVASEVKATDLQADTRPELHSLPTQRLRDELKVKQAESRAANSQINIAIYSLVRPGKFKLLFENPQKKKIKILLKDERDFTLYEYNSFTAKYNRDFDLVGMKPGIYRLEVYEKQLICVRQFSLQYNPHQSSIDILFSETNASAIGIQAK